MHLHFRCSTRVFPGLSDIIRIKYTAIALLKAWLVLAVDYQVANNAKSVITDTAKKLDIFPCTSCIRQFCNPP